VFQSPVTLTGTAGSPKTITVNANSDAAGLSFQNGATTFSNLSVILNAGRLDFSTQNATSTNAPVQLNNTGTNFISFGKYSNFSTGYENAVTMSGALSGSGGFTLQGFYTSTVPVASNGMLTLSSTSNSYRGDTGIQDGILRLGASNVIPDGASAGNLVMNSGTVRAGQLNLNGFNETVNGLFGTSGSFTGQIYNNANATASTLTIGGGNATSSFAGLIMNNLTGNGTVALTKIGTGTQTLSGNNTYTGATQVNAGTLFINGNQSAATGNLTVSAGAILSGTGTIGGAVNINGTLAAGNSIGTLSTGNLTIASTGVLDVELGRSGVTPVSDLTNVTGTVNLVSGADLDLTLSAGLATPVLDDIFYLIRNDSNDAVTGVFTKLNGVNTTLNEGSQFSWNSLDWKITYTADFANSSFTGGNDVAIQIVPEPTTWGLLAASLTTVMLYRRRRA
jgi:autotransporter-associated beta strand protein